MSRQIASGGCPRGLTPRAQCHRASTDAKPYRHQATTPRHRDQRHRHSVAPLCRYEKEYAPLLQDDIDSEPPPRRPVRDGYMQSRLERFYAELAQFQPGQSRAAYEERLATLGDDLLPPNVHRCAPRPWVARPRAARSVLAQQPPRAQNAPETARAARIKAGPRLW